MSLDPLAELRAAPQDVLVYEEGWQSWSPVGVYGAGETSPRPLDALGHTMGWRPGKPLPERGFQGEGILAVVERDTPVRVWYSPDPGRDVASIRLEPVGDRLVVSADGPVAELTVEGLLEDALAALGDRLGPDTVVSIPPGWCSWSAYFGRVTEDDVVENVDAARRLALPIEIVQLDDGYEAGIGDWLDASPRFGSLRRTASRILAAGLRPGLWTAPFLVGERSALAQSHPDWLVRGADAGRNWDQRLRVLDVTHPAAAAYLAGVYRTLADWGFGYHKLDFLYAGAIDGGRHTDCSPLEAYREGLRLIRDAAGAKATLLGSGAPLLPSIGLVDAMRIGGDVLPEPRGEDGAAGAPDLANAIRVCRLRAWMHGRLWASDPDSLVARPELKEREAWVSHVAAYGGLTFSSDRLDALDERGLELTRDALRPSTALPRP